MSNLGEVIAAGAAMAGSVYLVWQGAPDWISYGVAGALGSGLSAGFRIGSRELAMSNKPQIMLNWIAGTAGGIFAAMMAVGLLPFLTVEIMAPLTFWLSLVAALFARELSLFRGAGEIIKRQADKWTGKP